MFPFVHATPLRVYTSLLHHHISHVPLDSRVELIDKFSLPIPHGDAPRISYIQGCSFFDLVKNPQRREPDSSILEGLDRYTAEIIRDGILETNFLHTEEEGFEKTKQILDLASNLRLHYHIDFCVSCTEFEGTTDDNRESLVKGVKVILAHYLYQRYELITSAGYRASANSNGQ